MEFAIETDTEGIALVINEVLSSVSNTLDLRIQQALLSDVPTICSVGTSAVSCVELSLC